MEKQISKHAATGMAIRKELKIAFPGVKFKITSSKYTGGSSVSVIVPDGFDRKQILDLVYKYEIGTFDGMTDTYHFDNKRSDIPQVMSVIVS